MAMTVNPDLQSERNKVSFNVKEITHFIDGGEERTRRRKEIEKVLFSDPIFKTKDAIYQSRAEQYTKTVERSCKLHRLRNKLNWSDKDFATAVKCIRAQNIFTLHSDVFVPALEGLSTPEQKAKWLEKAKNFRIIGAYAQTELGHGSNLRGLETTATYDPAKEEFVLNTPKLSSMKWWPGGMARTANHCVLMAQLIIGGKNYGMQPFMLQLRSMDDHKLMPGIQMGDIGPKMGVIYNDNAYLVLNNVRIPRFNMLMKNAQVSKEGKFSSRGPSKANYSTMMLVRMGLVGASHLYLQYVAIAVIRYSAVRRQSRLSPDTPEMQVLDYQTQQHKIFPALTGAYAFFIAYKQLAILYDVLKQQIAQGDFSNLQEFHISSSGLKALSTDIATAEIEICRRSCGGHGYLLASGIADSLYSCTQLVTAEGENTVLYLQVGRYLLKQMLVVLSGGAVKGSTEYLGKDWTTYMCPVQTESDCRNLSFLLEIYKKRAHGVALNVAERIQTDRMAGMPDDVVMNNSLQPLVRAATGHCYLLAVQFYIDGVQQMNVSEASKKVMTNLCYLFAVHYLVKLSGDFLETGAVGTDQLKWLKKFELQLLAEIRPEAVGLVDAFDVHDETLCSAIGSYDGRAYERLYESAMRDPLNNAAVHPSYFTHLRTLMTEDSRPKL